MRRVSAFLIFILLLGCLYSIGYGSDIRRSPVVKAVEAARPSVVNISTEIINRRYSPFGDIGDPRLDKFFRDFFEGPFGTREYKRTSLGSGVIIRKDGYILTNEHVILRASKITVTLLDGRSFPAVVVGSDPSSDLAILKIKSKSLPTIQLGDSDGLMIGETLIAIGNPFGLSHTVTTGVVSANHRSFRTSDNRVFTDFIQTDASINPGNSGGPLLNIEGDLIGINTAIYGEAQGIGFAIPINRVTRIVENLIDYGEVRHGWIGLRVVNLDFQLAKKTGLEAGRGVYVKHVFKNSPAGKAGFFRGDVILELNGNRIASLGQYRSVIQSVTVGSKVRMSVLRNGKNLNQELTATELPIESAEQFAWRLLGIDVIKNSPKVARNYGLKTIAGMVISKVRVKSPAQKVGILPGDVLLAISGKSIDSLEDFHIACASLRLAQSAIIAVARNNRSAYLSLRLE